MSTIASLSAGEFVGMVADNPDQITERKTFHSKIIADHQSNQKEKRNYLPLPVFRSSNTKEVMATYQVIKQDVQDLIDEVLEDMLNDPARKQLFIQKVH